MKIDDLIILMIYIAKNLKKKKIQKLKKKKKNWKTQKKKKNWKNQKTKKTIYIIYYILIYISHQ